MFCIKKRSICLQPKIKLTGKRFTNEKIILTYITLNILHHVDIIKVLDGWIGV